MKVFAAAGLLSLALAAHGAPAPNVAQDVNHLLGYIAKSGCDFYRNGAWTDAATAEARTRSRFERLAQKGDIATVGDFIEKAASRSSVTGLPYQVKCGGHPPLLTRAWLSEELARYQQRR